MQTHFFTPRQRWVRWSRRARRGPRAAGRCWAQGAGVSPLVYRMNAVLSRVVQRVPVGTNLGLFHCPPSFSRRPAPRPSHRKLLPPQRHASSAACPGRALPRHAVRQSTAACGRRVLGEPPAGADGGSSEAKMPFEILILSQSCRRQGWCSEIPPCLGARHWSGQWPGRYPPRRVCGQPALDTTWFRDCSTNWLIQRKSTPTS